MSKLRIAYGILKNPTTRRVVLEALKYRFVQRWVARWAIQWASRYLSRR
jgi:hypothetical protein